MTGHQFRTGPWMDITWLRDTTRNFYTVRVDPKVGTLLSVTAGKIIEKRGWAPSVSLYRSNLDEIIAELDIMYVPRQMDPGPCVVFPLRDYRNMIVSAKVHPFYDIDFGSGQVSKYVVAGAPVAKGTPTWFGDSDRMLEAIVHHRSVLLVEGTYDLLACRLLCPDLPILALGGKRLSDAHIDYLRMLGVQKIRLMFDNDIAKVDQLEGSGLAAMRSIKQKWDGKHGLEVIIHQTVSSDPSDALKTRMLAWKLRDQIKSIFQAVGAV
jgi:hypothetical protein